MKLIKGVKLLTLFFILTQFHTAQAAREVKAVPGEYVVKLKNNVGINSIESLSANLGVEVISVILKDQKLILVKRQLLENSSSAIASLKNNPMVVYAEPNYIYSIDKLPNDPMLENLWGMKNFGQKDSGNKAGKTGVDVSAEKAWEISTGSKKVVVAVIDTGVDYTIEDLKDNMWTNEKELNGEAGVDDDGNGYVDDIHGYDFANSDGDPKDDHGHGSHCSGTIGAKGNNNKGVVGVNWNVSIMGVKFLTGSGSGSLANAIKAIDYATKMGVDIMSNSWGGGGFSEALKEAIERAHDKGVLFTAAAGNHAGNNDSSPSYPASYDVPNVISVAAVDNKGRLASFSCYGKTSVHIGAPGVNILSTTLNGFESWSGTSMATPHVTGVAALLLANEPSLTAVQIKERLLATAKPISSLRSKVSSKGIVDAYYALTNTQPPSDKDDPFNWTKMKKVIETPHPYDKNYEETFNVKVDGAKRISLHFKKFELERNYDFLYIEDVNGNQLDKIDGKHDDEFSAVYSTNEIILKVKADKVVNKYGFDIDFIAFE